MCAYGFLFTCLGGWIVPSKPRFASQLGVGVPFGFKKPHSIRGLPGGHKDLTFSDGFAIMAVLSRAPA